MLVLGPWHWNAAEQAWGPPADMYALLDLRSIPHMSVPGGSPQGYGLFRARGAISSDYLQLAQTMHDRVEVPTRAMMRSMLGVDLESVHLEEMIFEALTVRADPTGETFARPLMPGSNRRVELWTRGKRFNTTDFPAALHQIREEYRELRKGGGDLHRRVLDYQRKKLGLPWQALIPQDLKSEPGPLPHKTTITESFNTADSDTLGPDLTWTEVVGDIDIVTNQAVGQVSTSRARAESDLSSSDHWAEGYFVANDRPGLAVRYASAADTCYAVESINYLLGYKVVTGTRTSFWGSSDVQAYTALSEYCRLQINGSMLSIWAGATSPAKDILYHTFVDTSISSGTRCGITAFTNGAIDSWKASDENISPIGSTRYFSTAGAGSEDGTSWSNRAALFVTGNWSSIITGYDFTQGGLTARVGPGSYSVSQTLQNSLFTNAPQAEFPLVFEAADSSGDQLAVPDPTWISAQPVWDDTNMPVWTLSTEDNLTGLDNPFNVIFRLIKIVSAVAPVANIGTVQNGLWHWCFLSVSWSQSSGYVMQGAGCYPVNCCIHHTGTAGNGVGYAPPLARNVRAVSTGTNGAGFKTANSAYQPYVQCTSIGWQFGFNYDQPSDGWQYTCWRNLAADATWHGFNFTRTNTPATLGRITNCVAVNNGGYGVNTASGTSAIVSNGYFRDNTSGNFNVTGDIPTDFDNIITGASGDFVDEDAASRFDKDYRFSKTGPYAGLILGPGWED